MSEWRYECPRCGGKYREWNKRGDEWTCPFCSLPMGRWNPDGRLIIEDELEEDEIDA